MIPRTAGKSLNRIASSGVASGSRLPVRHISSAVRPSSIALGKRPYVPLASTIAVRHLSLTPWKKEIIPEPASEPIASTSTSASTNPAPLENAATPAAPVNSAAPVDASAQVNAAAPVDVVAPVANTSATATTGVPDIPVGVDLASPMNTIHTLSDATLGDVIRMNPDVPLDTILHSPEAISAVATRADLSLIGLDHSWYSTIGWTVDALNSLHNLTGTPWWLTIGILVFFIRLVIFRTVIDGTKHNARMAAIAPEIQRHQQQMVAAQKSGNQQELAITQQSMLKLFSRHDVNPLRMLKVPIMQFPIFISMFYGLQRMGTAPLPGFLEGGFSWVTDLTVPDPYMILPLATVALTNIVVRVGGDGMGQSPSASGFQRHVKNFLTVFSIPMFYFIYNYPAAVLFYWVTTNMFTVCQALLMKQRWFKRWAEIPIPPSADELKKAGVPPPPTMMETWRYARDGLLSKYSEAREAQEAAQGRAVGGAGSSASAGKASPRKHEIIRERKR